MKQLPTLKIGSGREAETKSSFVISSQELLRRRLVSANFDVCVAFSLYSTVVFVPTVISVDVVTFISLAIEFGMSAESDLIKMKALGRHFDLGTLYNYTDDDIISSKIAFNKKSIVPHN